MSDGWNNQGAGNAAPGIDATEAQHAAACETAAILTAATYAMRYALEGLETDPAQHEAVSVLFGCMSTVDAAREKLMTAFDLVT